LSSIDVVEWGGRSRLANLEENARLNGLTPVTVGPSTTESSIITLLNSGHGFTAPSPSPIANTDDTSTFLFGSQSLRLTTQGGGVSQIARKTGLTSTDMTGKMFRVTFMVDQPTHLANLRFDVSSDTFTNWSQGLFVTSNATIVADPLLAANTWYQITIPWGLFTVGGGAGATRSAITAVQLLVKDDNTGNVVNVWLDKIAAVAEPSVSLITFTFDDGRDGAFTKAKPILDAAGWRASWAPIYDKVGQTNYMTMAQNYALRDAGWDPCVHAYTSVVHNNYQTVSDEDAINDTLKAKAWMREVGLGPADNFLIPKGGLTSKLRDDVYRKNFTLVRTTFPSLREAYPPGRNWNLRPYNPGTKAVATVEGIIDEAVTNKEWLILQLHQVADSADGDNNTVLTADFQTLVTYIQGKGTSVKVKSLAEVVATGTA
jgi:peptidoglycan/xylan/chitin deacetylase (PgdA/CDA1 family)